LVWMDRLFKLCQLVLYTWFLRMCICAHKVQFQNPVLGYKIQEVGGVTYYRVIVVFSKRRNALFGFLEIWRRDINIYGIQSTHYQTRWILNKIISL